MPIRVGLDGPPRNAAAKGFARGIRFTVGSILLVLGTAAFWPLLILTFAVVWWLFGAGADKPSGVVLPLWLATAAFTWFAYGVGGRLQTGSRRMVLYLRRFGDTDSTRTVSAAIVRIGGYWRIVTLDDGHVSAVGARGARALDNAGRWSRLIRSAATRVGNVVWATLLLAVGGVIALSVTGHHGVLDGLLGLADARNPEGQTRLFWNVAYGILGFSAVVLAACAAGIVAAPFSGAASSIARSIRLADGRKALRIVDEPSIRTARQIVLAQSKRVISARLFVLTVHSKVWRETVRAFGADAAVPLIDVTEPTEAILWEIDQMRERFGRRCVFVGQYERLGHLFVIPELGSLTARLQQRLDGCDVLAYRTTGRGPRHFTHALRASLEIAASTHRS
ncbi:hypothetical protein [Amycolatopsis sp. NPDC003731]